MKNFYALLSLFFFVLLALPSVSVESCALQEYQCGIFEYIIENGEITVTGIADEVTGNVTVPEKIDGFTVCAVGERAFANADKITSVVLPESVKSIGNEAFFGCSSLEKIDPGKVEKLGYELFAGCTSLTEFSVPYSVLHCETNKENKGAFYAGSVEKVVFGKRTTHVADYLFSGCDSLKEVVMPDGIISIGKRAFDSCSSLEKVVFPGSLDIIENEAFLSCSALRSVSLPENVTRVGSEAFKNCTSLLSINLSRISTMGYAVFENCTALDEIVVPETLLVSEVSSDGRGVLSLSGVKRVVFRNGITAVPEFFCAGCKNLKEVVFSSTITSIGKNAFSGCQLLTGLTFSEKLNRIEEYAFQNCSGIEYVCFPSDLQQVKDGAFMGCTGLLSADLGKIEKIGVKVFYNCNKLSQITVPETLTYAKSTYDGYGPFSCSTIKKVVFRYGIKKIPSRIFSKCDFIEQAEIPHSVTEIGKGAFDECSRLSKVYYTADKIEWAKITKNENNEYLLSADMEFNYDSSGCTHSYTKYLSDNNATYSSDGTKTAYCDKNCGRSLTVKDKGSKLILGVTSKFTASQTDTTVTLKWNKVRGADGYRIYLRNTATGRWNVLSTNRNTTSFKVKKLKSGTKYTFALKAYVNESGIIWSPRYVSVHTATKPESVTRIYSTGNCNSIKLTWEKVNCTFYRVFRYDSAKRKWTTAVRRVNASSTTIDNLKSGAEYIFAVRPCVVTDNNKNIWSETYTKRTVYTSLPDVNFNLKIYTADTVEIKWNGVNGADGYQVWYCVDGEKLYKKLGNFKGNKARHGKLKNGKTYSYKVRAYKKVSSGYSYSKFVCIKRIKIK